MTKSSTKTPMLVWMILLSLALGIFISYFFVFVNALFISEIGTSKLPLAYILSGLAGTFVTSLFNQAERKMGFGKAATAFCLFFGLVMFGIWYFFIKEIQLKILIFFAYSWFWVSINFTALVFWKLPSNLFDLNENKKYNGVISSGEVISAIIAYLSVPVLLSFESFTRDKLILISWVGITLFSIITLILSRFIQKPTNAAVKKGQNKSSKESKELIKEPYFRLIFLSVFLAVIIQLLIDYSLMEVSANQYSDSKELAKYFAFLFGGMRLLELILKTFVSKYIISEYGVLISLSSLIFSLAFVTIIGLSSLFIGYVGLILIVASLGKVFERSLYRSVYAPAINILYQAYPAAKRALTQNYADGFGKTIGQLFAAGLIFFVASLESFESKIVILLVGILAILVVWFIISKKLILQYKLELTALLKSIQDQQKPITSIETQKINPDKNPKKTVSNNNDKLQEQKNPIQLVIEYLKDLWEMESLVKNITSDEKDMQRSLDLDKVQNKTIQIIQLLKTLNNEELLLLENRIDSSISKLMVDSKITPLFKLILNVELIKKSRNFNFFNSIKKLKMIDFLPSSLIQNLTKQSDFKISDRDYFFLLEDRINKYTYLLASLKDLAKSSPHLSYLIQSEAKSTQLEILYILHFKYNSKNIDQIILMLNQNEKNQELIALELLELLLKEQEKKWILPVLREENFEKILSKLELEFAQANLGKEKRLISIISNTEIDIPGVIRSHAILELLEKFPSSENTKLVKTIEKNSREIMQYMAQKVLGELKGSNLSTIPFPKYYKELITPASDINRESDEISLSSYLYWKKEIRPFEKHRKTDFTLVYYQLYQAAFPKEIPILFASA